VGPYKKQLKDVFKKRGDGVKYEELFDNIDNCIDDILENGELD
jgi:hypothetical protein